MDLPESTKILYNRIKKVEPENVYKILSYLFRESSEREMIQLASCGDPFLNSLISQAKENVTSSSSSPICFTAPCTCNRNSNFAYSTSVPNLSYEDKPESSNSNHYPTNHIIGPRVYRRSLTLSEFPVKICQYYLKGHCRHGSNCRYFHGRPTMEMFQNEFPNDESILTSGSLERLEKELTELLRSRQESFVPIASLPTLYHEKYGRTLQAEGYLTESQRQGKAGYSLTKLLARLKNSIHVINKPHGQHFVILAEDAGKYAESIGERSDHVGFTTSSSRQLYLTFPAESTFSELDVAYYFRKFGPVQDVRIPCQQKRMYGFVTFVYPETVRQILAKGNPHHYVCGARVLVKPYREKSRLIDRKYAEELQHPIYPVVQSVNPDLEFPSMARGYESSKFLGKQDMVEYANEFKRRNLSKLHLSLNNSSSHSPLFNFLNDDPKRSEEEIEFQDFSYLLEEEISSGSNTDDPKSSQEVNISERPLTPTGTVIKTTNIQKKPFTPPIGTKIKTAT